MKRDRTVASEATIEEGALCLAPSGVQETGCGTGLVYVGPKFRGRICCPFPSRHERWTCTGVRAKRRRTSADLWRSLCKSCAINFCACDLLSETVQRTAARSVRGANPKRRADDRPGSDRATTVGGKARAARLTEEPGVALRKSQRATFPQV